MTTRRSSPAPVFSPTLGLSSSELQRVPRLRCPLSRSELRERAWPLALAVAGGLQILRNTRLPAPDGQPCMPTRLSAFILVTFHPRIPLGFPLTRRPFHRPQTAPAFPSRTRTLAVHRARPASPRRTGPSLPPPPLVPKIPTDKKFADGPGHALSPPGMLLSVFARLLPAAESVSETRCGMSTRFRFPIPKASTPTSSHHPSAV